MTDPIIKHYNLAGFRAGSLIDPDNHERIILLTFFGGGHMFTKLIGWSGRFLILAHDHPLVHWKLDNEGNRLQAQVVSVTDTHVTVDLNHPLAGETLHFKGKVLGVRDATEQELKSLLGGGCSCGDGGCGCGDDCDDNHGCGCGCN